MEENRRKSFRTKLEIAAALCNSVDFTSKMIMMDYFFVVQTFLTNNTSCTPINCINPFFIRYFETSLLLFSLRNRFGVPSEPPKKLFEAFLTFQSVIITSTCFINSTKTYCARFLSFFVQGVASIKILPAGVKLKAYSLSVGVNKELKTFYSSL